jgi:hypothetical protein
VIKWGLFGNMHNRMSPGDYIQALRLQLLVRRRVWMCYRVAVEEDFNHLLHCQAAAGREMAIRHDGMRSCLAKFCKKCVGFIGVWNRR